MFFLFRVLFAAGLALTALTGCSGHSDGNFVTRKDSETHTNYTPEQRDDEFAALYFLQLQSNAAIVEFSEANNLVRLSRTDGSLQRTINMYSDPTQQTLMQQWFTEFKEKKQRMSDIFLDNSTSEQERMNAQWLVDLTVFATSANVAELVIPENLPYGITVIALPEHTVGRTSDGTRFCSSDENAVGEESQRVHVIQGCSI